MSTATDQISDANPDGSKTEGVLIPKEEKKEVKEGEQEKQEEKEEKEEQEKTGDEGTGGSEEVVEDPNAQYLKKPDGTDPDKTDAGTSGVMAKTAYELREEKRKRKALEEELAAIKAGTIVPAKDRPVLPDRSNYDSDTEYNQAMGQYTEDLTDYKIETREIKSAATHAASVHSNSVDSLEASFLKQAEEAVKEYPDFFERVEQTDFTTYIREAVFNADNKAKIAYHLTHNDVLRNKLIKSSPVIVAMEITRLDDKFTRSLKGKKRTETPAPINPVGGASKASGVLTKPIAELSAAEYYDAKKAGLIKE